MVLLTANIPNSHIWSSIRKTSCSTKMRDFFSSRHSSVSAIEAIEETSSGTVQRPSANFDTQNSSKSSTGSIGGGAADSTGGLTNTDTGTAKAEGGAAMTTIKQNTMIDAASDDLLMLMWKEKREAHDRCVCEYITF